MNKMGLKDLESKWEEIDSFEDIKGFKALRISNECIPDLFMAIDKDGRRCLILFLPIESAELRDKEMENLSLIFIPQKEATLIRLQNANFIDLFNDLITSIYQKINDINDLTIASSTFISIFSKWTHFFEPSNKLKLSEDEIRGVFGELSYLNNVLQMSSPGDGEKTIESWQGPFNKSNDFIFESKNVEIKTKLDSASTVRISSEFQLEREFDKALELCVISLKYDLSNGLSISDILSKIVDHCRLHFIDLVGLYRALGKLSLTPSNIVEYNNFRYIISNVTIYDAGKSAFPKICTSNLPEEISNVKFSLRVSTLDSFIIDQKDSL